MEKNVYFSNLCIYNTQNLYLGRLTDVGLAEAPDVEMEVWKAPTIFPAGPLFGPPIR